MATPMIAHALIGMLLSASCASTHFLSWWKSINHLTTVYIASLGADETALDRADYW